MYGRLMESKGNFSKKKISSYFFVIQYFDTCKICKGDDARSESGPGMLIYIMASEMSDSR